MKIQLSDHFTYRRLLRFTLPSIVMMIFTSIYSIVDGLFVSNLVGDLALSAVNIVMPVIMIVGAFGFMLGTGGERGDCQDHGRRKAGTGKPVFLHVRMGDCYFGNCPVCDWHHFYGAAGETGWSQ